MKKEKNKKNFIKRSEKKQRKNVKKQTKILREPANKNCKKTKIV